MKGLILEGKEESDVPSATYGIKIHASYAKK
jgi:hypothetical protein